MEMEITSVAERIAGDAVPSPERAGGPRAPGAGDEVLFREVLNGNGDTPVFALGEPRGGTVKAGAAGLSGGLGEAILQGIENVSRSQAGQIERINGMVAGAGEEPLSPAELMRLQYEVMMLAFEQELAARVVDKVDQGIQTLFKTQG
ncbi:MAG TPA: EscI/YscI/HrpB family type III secretion system inner rod protein [Syntrophales bacterium]|nr:EscI/YscI/HrpB family type III secretion system inner rod protein [Syntrophales bacterium]HQN77721.1 EscI/YscI/HrpB family type III secretion system inner rod protein [Syntrophales bacterium]HQQ27091.1 EscI/YscI/HrpB family type III secretion system inner rod protein [Syntrophales bacterium]